ncbi:hypothetical protein AcV5_008981 [Taiwanofungus camphoratus]|nr:hypothetical protein AcV5_008981 [Antrodia cinnamomea]
MMASLEAFESTLKEVVQAKRLSASKMEKLTDIALKCMQNDTQLVSILFRTHKSLSTAAKVPSLYTFDALSRAARNQVNKQGLTGDINSEQGNCATFLLKVEGVLDSLFQDLVSSGTAELKEKSKKILDIWVKSNTFPSAVLARLSRLLKGETGKEPDKVDPAPAADPRSQSTPSTSVTPPQASPTPENASSVQSTLLALLSQAANAVASTSNNQTTSNTATSTPALDANQLALFQQLTQAAKLGNGVPSQLIPLPVSLVPSSNLSTNAVPVVHPAGGPSQPLPYRDDHYGSGRRESNHDRYGGPVRARDRDDSHHDRRDFRGGRSSFRGRVRGRWDDHHRYRGRSRDQDWTPPRGRRSRSRSPSSRYGGRRDVKPFSPPPRPSVPQTSRDKPSTDPAGPIGAPHTGKDEFGRDLRAASPKDTDSMSGSNHVQPPSALKTAQVTTLDHGLLESDVRSPTHPGPLPQVASTSNVVARSQKGLDAFDASMFDPSSPASWEALGNAWAVTHGYMPSQAELMQFTISGGLMGLLPVSTGFDMQGSQWPAQDNGWVSHQSQSSQGAWRGGRGMRGRGRVGDYGYGNSRDADYAGQQAYEQQNSDMLAHESAASSGYDSALGSGPTWPNSAAEGDSHVEARVGQLEEGQEMDGESGSSGDAGPGRMQRMGDKWVFVRTEASAPEVA